MKIYCAHSSGFDYQHEWYDVLRKSKIAQQYELFFPHELAAIIRSSYEAIQSSDYVIAEVSHSSTGMGIELGWAQTLGKPIFCFYKTGTKPSGSLVAVTQDCLSYNSHEELIQSVAQCISINIE